MTKKRNIVDSPKVVTPAFAERLKARRLSMNWSLRDAEKRAGANLSRQTFLRAEQGDVALDNLLYMLRLYAFSQKETTEMLELWSKAKLVSARAEVKAAQAAEAAA